MEQHGNRWRRLLTGMSLAILCISARVASGGTYYADRLGTNVLFHNLYENQYLGTGVFGQPEVTGDRLYFPLLNFGASATSIGWADSTIDTSFAIHLTTQGSADLAGVVLRETGGYELSGPSYAYADWSLMINSVVITSINNVPTTGTNSVMWPANPTGAYEFGVDPNSGTWQANAVLDLHQIQANLGLNPGRITGAIIVLDNSLLTEVDNGHAAIWKNSVSVSVVPLPSALLMGVMGLVASACVRRTARPAK